jgi:hypothetical protein
MKPLLSILACAGLTLGAFAIPQTFNNNPFLAATGSQFEEAAGQVAAFEPGAEPKGQWAPVHGQKDALKLKLDAVVFGIPASEITAQRAGDRIAKYQVLYRAADDRKRGKQESSLEARVLAGVSAFTGKSATPVKPTIHRDVQITVKAAANGDVTVEFARAS